MLYTLLGNIKFNYDYKKLLEIINTSDKIVIKNKPNNKYNIDYDRFGIYKEYIIEFVNIFKTNFSTEIVDNMLKNLSTLKIKTEIPKKKRFVRNTMSLGYYNSNNNEIVIRTNDHNYLRDTLIHELLHMSSVNKKSGENYCGFNIKNKIGLGINEDYTEYLLERYYSKKMNIYPREDLLLKIEYLVGKDKLEKLYFNSDLKGLLDEISKYATEKEAIRLLFDYDSIYFAALGYNMVEDLEKRIDQLIGLKDYNNSTKKR